MTENIMINESDAEKIFSDFYRLIRKVESESPLLQDGGLCLSFSSKFMSLKIMQRYTIEKARKTFAAYSEDKAYIKEKGNKMR
jgi:hypothetical protein